MPKRHAEFPPAPIGDVLDVLENRYLKAFFVEHEATLTDSWKAAETVEARERLHAQVTAVRDFKEALYGAAKRKAHQSGHE